MQIKAELQVLDEPVKPVDSTGLTTQTGLTAQSAENTNLAVERAEDQDWRVPIISYLKDPSRGAERSIRRASF